MSRVNDLHTPISSARQALFYDRQWLNLVPLASVVSFTPAAYLHFSFQKDSIYIVCGVAAGGLARKYRLAQEES